MTNRDPILEPHLTEIEREQDKQRFQNQFMLGMLRGSGVPSEKQEDVRGVLPPGIVGSLDQPPPGLISNVAGGIFNRLRQIDLPANATWEALRAFGVPFSTDIHQFTNRFSVPTVASPQHPLSTIPPQGEQVIATDPIAENSREVISDLFAGTISIPDAAGALRENFEKRSTLEQIASPSVWDVPIPVAFGIRRALKLFETAGLNKRLLNEIAQAASKPQLGVIPEGTTSRFIDDAGDPITPATRLDKLSRERIRLATKDAITSGSSDEFVFHVGSASKIDNIVNEGLIAGGYDSSPMLDKGLGEVIHVFRKDDLAKGLDPNFEGMINFEMARLGIPKTQAPRPVATFTWRQLGKEYDELPEGFRAQELGFEGEPPLEMLLPPGELAAVRVSDAAKEIRLVKKIENIYARAGDTARSQRTKVILADLAEGRITLAESVDLLSKDFPRIVAGAAEDIDPNDLIKATKSTPTFEFGDDVLDNLHRSWRAVPGKTITSVSDKLTTAKRWVETELVDKFALANEIAGGSRKWWKTRFGAQLPANLDVEIQFALLSGRPSAGARLALDVVESVKTKMGGLDEDLVNTYLAMRHQLDVVKLHPTRKISGFEDVTELQGKWNLFQEKLGPETLAIVEDAAGEVRNFYKNSLERMVDSGLVPRDLADALNKHYPWYNPIRYVDTDLARGVDGGVSKASNTRNGLRYLSDIGSDMPTEGALGVLFQAAPQIETLIARNNAARALIRSMLLNPDWQGTIRRLTSKELTKPVAQVDEAMQFRPRQGEIPGTVSYMKDGKRVAFEVPREVEALAKAGAMLPAEGLLMATRFANAVPRALMVTFHPVFMTTQFLLDAMTVAITHGVMPWKTGAVLIKNIWRLNKHNEDLAEMIRSGGDVGGFWGRTASEQLARSKKDGSIAIQTPFQWRDFLDPRKIPSNIRDIGHSIELSPRVAVFNKALERGASKDVAAILARRSTVDFDRIGNSMRYLNAMYLFLNPAVQGSLIPYRALKNPATRKYALMGMSGYMSAQVMAYAWNRQFPEYKDVLLHDKYGGLGIMIPSNEVDEYGKKVAHFAKIIPNVREFAALSGPLIFMLGKLDDTSPETFGQWAKTMLDQVMPTGPISASGIVPTQPLAAVMDSIRNYDSFRDREIVPLELEGQKPKDQVNKHTSLLARRVGNYLDISPMKIDFWMRQGVFYDLVIAADATIRATEGEDPVIAGIVAQLEDIQHFSDPDEVVVLRRALLNDLDTKTRAEVEAELNKPKPKLPLVTSAVDRFYRRTGGNMYSSGLAIAEAETGLSSKQTRTVSALLGSFTDEIDEKKEANDQALMNGEIGYSRWLSTNQDFNGDYSAALLALGKQFPKAAQVQDDPEAFSKFLEIINTLGGSEPDRRTMGSILVAGLRAIPLGDLAVGVQDWDTFFDLQNKYIEELSESDQEILQEELDSRLSPLEKEKNRDFDYMEDYLTMGTLFLHTEEQRDLYKEYRKVMRTKGSEAADEFAAKNEGPFIIASDGSVIGFAEYVNKTISANRVKLRANDQLLDALLRKWERTESYKHQFNIAAEIAGVSVLRIAAHAQDMQP